MPSIFVQIVTYNSPPALRVCVEAVLQQRGSLIERVQVSITDNASLEDPLPAIMERFDDAIRVKRNAANLGFCAGNNQGVAVFLAADFDFFLMLNPDVRLESGALQHLLEALRDDPGAGSACPKLYRANESLQPITPRTIDAAGMVVTSGLRHLDRGSGESDTGTYDTPCRVFGGSGACLLLKREFILDALLDGGRHEEASAEIFPALSVGGEQRAMLLDEAFFAFREDADLAWRGQLLGWQCRYVPQAVGYHVRHVVPERRGQLSPEINRHGVRNRFLLQLNNWFCPGMRATVIPGLVWRNLLVVAAVVLRERTSLRAFREIYRVLPRALERRRRLKARVLAKPGGKENLSRVGRWFSSR